MPAVNNQGRIQVTLKDGRLYQATIVGTDPSTDLAVIRLTNPPADLAGAQFGSSANLTVGSHVMAIGSPLGLSNTVTTGINSSIASLAQNSSDTAGSIGLGFAIPIDLVRSVADQLIQTGTVAHAILGVNIVTAAVESDGNTYVSARIESLVPGGAAEQAGLRVGDAITHVNGSMVTSARSPSPPALFPPWTVLWPCKPSRSLSTIRTILSASLTPMRMPLNPWSPTLFRSMPPLTPVTPVVRSLMQPVQ